MLVKELSPDGAQQQIPGLATPLPAIVLRALANSAVRKVVPGQNAIRCCTGTCFCPVQIYAQEGDGKPAPSLFDTKTKYHRTHTHTELLLHTHTTHTCAHIHTQTHTHAHMHTHASKEYVCVCVCVCACVCVRARANNTHSRCTTVLGCTVKHLCRSWLQRRVAEGVLLTIEM